MNYPIDIHIRNEQIHLREALNKAHDLGFDLALKKVVEMFEEIDTYPEGWDYDDVFNEAARLVRENFGVKDE
jgi:hypothetical protein